jgi:flagellar protein FliO/FliZ
MNPLDIIRAIAALAITLGLLIGAAWLARRYGLMQGAPMTASKHRLKLVEQLWLDGGKTRAVILSCDGEEHLVLLSPMATTALKVLPAKASEPSHDAA